MSSRSDIMLDIYWASKAYSRIEAEAERVIATEIYDSLHITFTGIAILHETDLVELAQYE